jgi:signal transduction histidine kinase
MAPTLALCGWAAAAAFAVCALIAWRALSGRMELVARACHELRGPITAARLGLELGARAGAPSADRLRAVDLELGRAALAIDDLVGAGLGSPGGCAIRSPAEFDLSELLADSVEAWRPAAAARGIELRLDADQRARIGVLGDRLRIAQATGNLISNAIEHGGGAVVVRVRSVEGLARVEFVDRGPGLPAPVAVLVRRPRRGRGSRGRGLAIASAVAGAHGGRLAAAPSEGGARLVLELPACGAVATSGAGPAPTERPGSQGPAPTERPGS